jgi:phosphate transport system protein
LAEAILTRDYEIDELEIEVEEECLKILALHQPVAVDLRFSSP